MTLIRTALACALLAAPTAAQPSKVGGIAPDPAPTVWMCDAGLTTIDTPDGWECTLANIDIVKLYIDEINSASQADLIAMVQLLNYYDIDIAIELGGLVDWHADKGKQSAEMSFANEFAKVRKLTDPIDQGGAGGSVAILDMDGPIRRMLWPNNTNPGYHTLETATDELADVMLLWADALPGAQVSLLINFPNWGWKGEPAYNNLGLPPGPLGYGDYFDAFVMAVAKTQTAGAPLVSVTIDNPYDYAIGEHNSNQDRLIAGIDWMGRILDLEAESTRQSLAVNVVFNSERGGQTSGALFAADSLAFIDLYLARGGTPEGAIMQSWYPYPDTILPETT
ncbi:hypothetical protein MNBD_PLANCTO03-2064, partial [hydrothermal vent metagenome]